MPTPIDPHIFRAYDIRGKAGPQITEDACRKIGFAFGETVKEKYGIEHPCIVVGRDARTHSASFDAAVTEGLLAAGCRVLSMGPTPSPVNYFTIVRLKLDGGIQITASHNPGTDNGLKLQTRDAEAFSGDDLQMLRKRIETDGERMASRGSTETIDAVGPYIDHYATLFAGAGRGLSIVTDCGNGIAGPVYNETLRRIGCTVTALYEEPDGTFPNHLADPSKWDTLKELQAEIRKTKAFCGLAFDGDGDRVGLVDEQATIRTADEMLLLLAQDYLVRFPGKAVIFTTSMSSTLDTEIRKWGGKPVMCAVGHSVVEHAMREHGAPLGGEQSGHFFLEDVAHGYDDALAVALQLIKIMHAGKKPPSSLFEDFPKVFHAPELRPHCPDNKKRQIVESITKHFSVRYPVNTTDGARIDFGDGAWANVRFSNTAPKLSVCIEARSADKLRSVEGEVLAQMRTYPEVEL
jgi:phosphomannomutase/phosphoglucomutase